MKKQTMSKRRKIFLAIWLSTIVLLLGGIILTMLLSPPGERSESIKELMKDAVLHEHGKVSFFGLSVNPAVVSAYTVTTVLLLVAALLRIFAIPRFRYTPGKLQSLLETAVGFFSGMARENSPRKHRFVGAYNLQRRGVYRGQYPV